MNKRQLRKMIKEFGGNQTLFAEKIQASQGLVSHWLTGRRNPSSSMVARISALTGIPEEKIRPDLFK